MNTPTTSLTKRSRSTVESPPSTTPPTELTLTRQCANVSKLVYAMRTNGDLLNATTFGRFDSVLRATVEKNLFGKLA